MAQIRGRNRSVWRRAGAIALQTAVMVILMLAIAACAVDFGWILMTKTQLQAVADASALAGGTVLRRGLGENRLSATTIAAAARQYADDYSKLHRNGDVTSTYLNPSRDVSLGWAKMNTDGSWQRNVGAELPGVGGYNMVRVVAHRDQTGSTNADRPLALFLAPVMGIDTSNVSAVATAVTMPSNGVRIEPGSTMTANMIPFTLSVDTWRKFLLAQRYFTANNRTRPNPSSSVQADMSNLDRGWYVPATGMWHNPPASPIAGSPPTLPEPLFGHVESSSFVLDFDDAYRLATTGSGTTTGGDGQLEVDIYPKDIYTSGNFGTIDIGSSANETSVVARQILSGVNASDLSYYPNNAFVLPRYTEGDTGISAGFKDELEAIKGQCRVIPLFAGDPVNPGNNALYYLSSLAGIRIMDVRLVGNAKRLTVQRCDTLLNGGLGDYDESITRDTTVFTPLILIE